METKVISAEKLEKGTIRIVMEANGHLFKRLSHPAHSTIVWHDEHGTFNGCQAMQPEQEQELESIFKAWMLENKTDEQKLLMQPNH